MKTLRFLIVTLATLILAGPAFCRGCEAERRLGEAEIPGRRVGWDGGRQAVPRLLQGRVQWHAVMETLDGPDAIQMITVYHPDGASLLMTHYCSMGNEPRMRSKATREWQDRLHLRRRRQS